jgi:Mg-chelatase subunit ChlD
MDGGEVEGVMETPTLAYLVAHPTALGIAASHPIVLMLLAGAAVFFLCPFPSFVAGRARSAGSTPASALRAAAFGSVILALAGVHLTTRVPSDRVTVVAAADLSASIDEEGRAWTKRYLDEVQAALAPGDELAVLTFAGDTALLRSPDAPAPIGSLPPPPAPAATDVSRAIDSAMALLPADGQRRILLITDGNETRGDSRRQVAWLRSAGVRLDAATPPHRTDPDLRVERVVAPPAVVEGHSSPIRVIAHNTGKPRPAVLNLYLDDTIADSAAVDVQPGRNALVLSSTFAGPGSHRLRAELTSEDDAVAVNNSADVGLTVRDRTRVLLVTGRDQSPIARALVRKGMAPTIGQAADLADLAALQRFHLVVLEDLSADSLPPGGLETLEHYVHELGGGLVFAGGAATYGDPALRATPLKGLLPVTLEPHRPRPGPREPLALFLVIDRSNSMGYNSRIPTLRDGEKLQYAKEAALAVVGQLRDQDLVGVIAFDSQPHEIAPLRSLKDNRSTLEDLLPRLIENGGTDFHDALVSAHEQLSASRVNRRHIILITDGDTNRAAPDEYRALVRKIAADKISITTVRIGDNTVNLKLLKDISTGTGGEFHYVDDAQMLPDLMLRETTRALGSATEGTEQFYPELSADNQLLQGIAERQMPPVSGYAYSKPKAGADVLLRVTRIDRQDPLLAVWHHGLGRVAAFTASPIADGSEWLGWPEFSKFWSQLAEWTARAHADDEYAIDASRVDGVTELIVRCFGPTADGATYVARLRVDDETARDVDLIPRRPRLFTARLLDLVPGRYPLTIIKRAADGTVTQHTQLVTIPSTDQGEQAEFEREESNLSLLTHLTRSTGGQLNPTARTFAEREPGSRRVGYPLDHLLLPLAMMLFLADTAIRKLRR